MKREETLELENALCDILLDRRKNKSFGFYGCEEVTIGFHNNGHGNEIVDFMTMDSKGVIRCYEIKVTMADLKSKAKLSWYGHYNFIVVGGELLDRIDEVKELVPTNIGIRAGTKLRSIRSPKKKNIRPTTEVMLYMSLVRTLNHKMNKYKDTKDLDKYRKLNNNLNRAKREKQKASSELLRLGKIVQRYNRKNGVNIEEEVEEY